MSIPFDEKFNLLLDSRKSPGGERSKNILIKGDNKSVLPDLVRSFGSKIKCVYIDPPYNNGDSYHYYNDKATSESWIGNIRKVLTWLRMLLTNDGSIWISIDDKEMAYLKVEADRVFGRDNFAATIVWQHRKTRENRAVFSYNHEYVLVYAKDIKTFKKSRNLLPVDEKFVASKYKNPDNDPRGPWQSVSASVQAGHAVASQFYTIKAPSGTMYNPPKGRCWVYNEERMLREIEQNNIWFGANGNNAPRIKKFLASAKIGLTPETLWSGDSYGTTDAAKKHLLALFPDSDNVFDTPKPEELIKHIIEIATNEGDYILDCYAGSGTTMAAAHKLKRNYIGIEVGDQMVDIVVKRLNLVINGESGGISQAVKWHGGGEFALYEKGEDSHDIQQPPKALQLQHTMSKYTQLDFADLFEQFGLESIPQNTMVRDDEIGYVADHAPLIDLSKHLLICNVKKDNWAGFENGTATIYYTGKSFPASVDLKKLFYFMPYLAGRGIRDLYVIKNVRMGFRKEGQADEDTSDLRLVFEIERIGRMFKDFTMINLDIWRTYKDTTLGAIYANSQL